MASADAVPSHADRTIYETVFGLSLAELQQYLESTLLAAQPPHPLSLQAFWIVDIDGVPEACMASWIEPSRGFSSGLLMATTMSRFLGRTRWKSVAANIASLSAASPARTAGAIQLESIYVESSMRGKGLVTDMLEMVIAEMVAANPSVQLAELSVLKENTGARRAYERSGFREADFTAEMSEEFFVLTGSRGFVKFEKLVIPAGAHKL